jgi:hypothetical protein
MFSQGRAEILFGDEAELDEGLADSFRQENLPINANNPGRLKFYESRCEPRCVVARNCGEAGATVS